MTEQYKGYHKAVAAAEELSSSSTYRGKFVHIEHIEDNYYQLLVLDYHLDGDDIAGVYKDGRYIPAEDELDTRWADSDLPIDADFHWSDDDSQ